MSRLDDPALVEREYADETRLRRRAAAYTGRHTSLDAREPLVAAVAAVEPARVLEVGCGWGELAARIVDATGAELVATDLSPRMVALSRERGIEADVVDVQALPYPDGSFDVAVAAWMLYHVPNLEQGIAELARVLRAGGRLVAATNSVYHLYELRELVGSGLSTIRFSRESGEELLGASFERVSRIDVDGELEFADRAEVEEYVRASISMSPFVQNLPEVVAEPLLVRRANSIFVADKA